MKILFCDEVPRRPETLRGLLPDEEILTSPAYTVAEVGLDVDVIIPVMHNLEPDLIAHTRARLIQQWGVGLEVVDIPGASARGILVCNVPSDVSSNAESTAEHAVFLMLGVARRIHGCLAAFRNGTWHHPVGEGLFGNIALIVGLGHVGKALAKRLKALGMNVCAVRRTANHESERALGLDRVGYPSDLLEMASYADFVISTTILTDESRGLFGKKLFHTMKPTAFVINVSRGGVVSERDLLEALKKGEIGGAGLDVFEHEPLDPNSPLLKLDNVFATPHVAGVTRQNNEGTGRIVAENIGLVKQGKTPLYCVNLADVRGLGEAPEHSSSGVICGSQKRHI